MLTLPSLHSRLKLLADSTRLTYEGCGPSNDAECIMDAGTCTIRISPLIPPARRLPLFLHELCHLALPGELAAFGTFEEAILEQVLEPALLAHINADSRRRRFWTARLEKPHAPAH